MLDRGRTSILDAAVLTKYVREPNAYTLDFYLQHERGYDGLRRR